MADKKTAKKAPAKKKTAAKKAPARKKAPTKKAPAKKKAVAKKTPAKKKTAAKKTVKPKYSAEQVYSMIEQAAYFAAENDGFSNDPTSYWTQAEAAINKMVNG